MVWHRNALRIYRALLLGYPAEFRHEYGEDMEARFAVRIKAESSFRLWPEVLADVMTTAPKEHLLILAADLRYCVRVLGRSPGFVFAALLAVILGLSATTTVFSLMIGTSKKSEDPPARYELCTRAESRPGAGTGRSRPVSILTRPLTTWRLHQCEGVKVAVAVLLASIVKVQIFSVPVLAHASDHPENVEPAFADAVSTTTVPDT